jgi:SAM-dependent methyltransferase
MPKEWFELWFDSPYYHILYQQHDDKEAQNAIDKLLGVMGLPGEARVLDLACGKGRHSRYLAEKGFYVTGLDISASSISYARQFENDRLEFYQHDMRLPFRLRYYDAIFNFFTSFGYFDNDHDHQMAILNVARGLKQGGRLLLDFFNSEFIRQSLVPSEEKVLDGIAFSIKKNMDDKHIRKSVEFEHLGKHYKYTERVRLLTLSDFESMFAQAGLRIEQQFGSYDLDAYNEKHSPRLILIAQLTP